MRTQATASSSRLPVYSRVLAPVPGISLEIIIYILIRFSAVRYTLAANSFLHCSVEQQARLAVRRQRALYFNAVHCVRLFFLFFFFQLHFLTCQ